MEEEMTLSPELQSRLNEIGQLGAEPPSIDSPQTPKVLSRNFQTFNAIDGTSGVTVGEPTVATPPNQIIGTPDDDKELNGTDGIDEIYGLEGNDAIAGFLSDDYIVAGPEKTDLSDNDNVVAGGGNDRVDGGWGSDLILGDFNPNADPDRSAMGDDTLNGGAGDDYLFGQNGKDTLNGDDGADTLYGGNGDDTLNGGSGNDIAEGGEGIDTIFGNSGDDTLRGDDGNDTLDGGSGKDLIRGGRGNDNLIGGSEDDELKGDLGNDTLEGGLGNDKLIGVDTAVLPVPELGFGRGEIDTLTGQQNNDTFVLGTQLPDGRDFTFYNDGNSGKAGLQDYALITDFGLFNNTQNLGLDKIQLAGLQSSYSLGASPISSTSGTGIFFTDGTVGTVPELIGIVKNLSPSQLNLANSSQFTFV